MPPASAGQEQVVASVPQQVPRVPHTIAIELPVIRSPPTVPMEQLEKQVPPRQVVVPHVPDVVGAILAPRARAELAVRGILALAATLD